MTSTQNAVRIRQAEGPTVRSLPGSDAAKSSSLRQMVVLVPADAIVPREFRRQRQSAAVFGTLLGEAQRVRGRAYLQDGAILPSQLTADGRFPQRDDDKSWHLLVVNAGGTVAGSARFRPHHPDTPFESLSVCGSALARRHDWAGKLRTAVENKKLEARNRGFSYVECGGWALSEEIRFSTAAAQMVLCIYGLARMMGGALGITTATTRHRSADMLRRIGGHSLHADGDDLPRYYDEQYKCEMEILGFDSSSPSARFEPFVRQCEEALADVTVVQYSTSQTMPRKWVSMAPHFANPGVERRLLAS